MTDARPVALVCALLDTVDSLSYPQRMRELAVRARRFREDGVLRAVLEELENGGGPYERGLAVVAAAVGQDREWIGRCLADEDPYVRAHALRVARRLGVPDSAYEEALADAPAVVRHRLMRAVVADGRTELADRLIDGTRATWGDAEAARLLPGCSTGTVNRLLPALFRSVAGWTALGSRHPGPLLDAAEQDLAAQPEALREDWWLWYGHDRAVAAAATRLPHRVLDLLERHGPSTLPPGLHGSLGPLAAADPTRLVRLLVAPGGLDPLAVSRSGALSRTVLHRLTRQAPESLVIDLARTLAGHGEALNRLLLALPPARRAAFHAAVVDGRGEGDTVDPALLDAMPRSHVAQLARRMADRARERGAHWSAVLLAESYLPPAEVREQLLTATRSPAAADRAEAWPLLIRNAGRSGDPSAVATALDDMLRLRNEQDPVRSAALRALLATAPALFTDEAETLLDRITTDAVDAPDSSPHTRSTLSALALGILREHTATGQRALVSWALRTLVRLSGSTGHADLGRLDRTLRRGQEHTVFEALLPWLEAGSEKSDYGLVFALTRALGRRATAMPELQELLWQAVRYGNNSAARTAIGLWLRPAADRDERVERVLAREPSAAALPDVIELLTGRRTDLLDPYLTESPPYGRFLTHGTSWTPPVRHSPRWVPRQQLAAARMLTRAARDEKLPLRARAAAVTELAGIPGHGADAIREWTASSDVVLAEAALAALARTDTPAGSLPQLLAHTGDDRARVAVYSASRAALHARPSVLGPLLRERTAPGTGKVTSRKEMVRLAATRLPVDGAAQVLADAYTTADQHPDVRAACVAFGTDLLGDERMWEVMTDAAHGGRALRTAVLRAHPARLAEEHRPRYARLVREVCASDDEELAALAHHTLARWVPWAPGACDVFVTAVIALERRGAWRSAADALVGAALGSPEAALALNRTLLALAVNDTADEAGSERDRPARQRIVHTIRSLTARAKPVQDTARPVLATAGGVLAAHRDFVPQAVELLVHAVDPEPAGGPGALHTELTRLAGLHEGRPVLASRTAGTLGELIGSASGETDGLLTVAARLTESGDGAEGLFAAAITAAAGRRTAWTGPWRTQLRLLRQHPVADVRDTAYAQVTATE